MKILIQFPTLARKEKFIKCLIGYVIRASNKNELFFNINCDEEDTSMNNEDTLQCIRGVLCKQNHRVNFLRNSNKINAINSRIDDIDFDVLICASDDMIPVVEDWDIHISKNMNNYFPDLDGCLHFNDGYTENKLITLSIMGKKLYDHFGYIYHPDYKSLYCDNEFTEAVYSMNKVRYIDHVIIKHEHYSREGNINSGDFDLAAKKTLLFSGRDSVVYNKRKSLNFPKEKITND